MEWELCHGFGRFSRFSSLGLSLDLTRDSFILLGPKCYAVSRFGCIVQLLGLRQLSGSTAGDGEMADEGS